MLILIFVLYKPLRLGPTKTTGRIDGTTSYGDDVSCFLKNGLRFSFVGGVANGVLPCRDGPIESDSSPTMWMLYGYYGIFRMTHLNAMFMNNVTIFIFMQNY